MLADESSEGETKEDIGKENELCVCIWRDTISIFFLKVHYNSGDSYTLVGSDSYKLLCAPLILGIVTNQK